MFPLLAPWAGVLRASQSSPSSPSKSSHHFDDTREVCLLDSRRGVLRHRTRARVCACHRSMTAAIIIRAAICSAFGAVRNGILLQMRCVWGPRSCEAQKGPLRESVSGNRNGCLRTTQSHFLRRFSGIYSNFFNIMDILGCPWTLLGGGGPAHHRISAENIYFKSNNANSIIAVTPKVTPLIRALRGLFA